MKDKYKYKVTHVLKEHSYSVFTKASKFFDIGDIIEYSELLRFASNHALILDSYKSGMLRILDHKGMLHLEAIFME